jgi:hypothetical protein
MARAYRGPYARPSSAPVPYATALVWGSGIDPIHSYYGEGPPLRSLGREGAIGSSPVGTEYPRSREYQSPNSSHGMDPPEENTWGYPVEYGPDSFGMGADGPISEGDTAPPVIQEMGDRPAWGDATAQEKVRRDASTMPPWGKSGAMMRAIRGGAERYRRFHESGSGYAPITAEQPNSFPTETVSEGWLNKTTSFVAESSPSDVSQYEVQTSMRQRFGTRDNKRATLRETDEERATIASRVEPMVEKVWSTGERSYDMFPYQIDQIERPFRNRTAGVGNADWMVANEYNVITPVQRTPPPDPAMGVPEVSGDFGYTPEDTMYYG